MKAVSCVAGAATAQLTAALVSAPYDEMYRRSVDDPDGFWSEIAAQFHWEHPWDVLPSGAVHSANLDVRKGPISIEVRSLAATWKRRGLALREEEGDCGWITGHSYVAYGPLLNGATQVVFEGVPSFPDWGRTWQVVEKHQVSIFYTAPTAIRAQMRAGDDIGAFAAPDKIHWAPGLPKTRSGKIMRRILRKIASNQLDELGDISTLADPSVVDQLIDLRPK
eukprot:jgi/Mesen1/5893/ME000003S06932